MLKRSANVGRWHLAIVAIMHVPVLATLGCSGEGIQVKQVATLELGQGRAIRLYVERGWEITQSWFYEVWEGEEVVSPLSMFGGSVPEQEVPALRVLTARDGTLVGVVEAEAPQVILILHDFGSGRSWPRGSFHDDWKRRRATGKEMLAALRAANPGVDLVLSHERGGAPGGKLSP